MRLLAEREKGGLPHKDFNQLKNLKDHGIRVFVGGAIKPVEGPILNSKG